MSPAPTIRIVRAGPEEVRHLVALLPHAAGLPTQAEFFAAIRDGDLLGGAALMIGKSRGDSPRQASFQLAMAEDAPAEAADLLAHAMKVLARREGAETLSYTGGAMDGSDLAATLERCNFSTRGEPISHFSIRTDAPTWRRFEAMYDKLKARARIPETAQILPLNRLATMPVNELLTRTIGGAGPTVQAELLNPETCSVGIQLGPVLKGTHVVTVHDKEAHTSHLAVDKAVRGGWLYTVLMTEVLIRLRERGVETWSYKTNPGIHKAMLNFAATMKASPAGTERMWVFPLEG